MLKPSRIVSCNLLKESHGLESVQYLNSSNKKGRQILFLALKSWSQELLEYHTGDVRAKIHIMQNM